MTRRWTGLSALLMLIPLVAPAERFDLRHLNWLAPIEGHVPRSDHAPSREAGPMGDELGPYAVDVQDFGLVSETEGWVISGSSLYWTESGGRSWHDISPVGRTGSTVLAVSFTDARRGWAVTKSPEIAGPGEYALARTLDGGTTWERIPLRLFPPGLQIAPASAVYLYFLDASTGWLVIKHVSSSNFSVGTLLKTSDGGSTWTQLSMPIGEPVYFATDEVGWTAGGAAGNALYRTVDGGKTWYSQNVVPGSAPEDQHRFYRLPAFQDEREGLLPVVAIGGEAQLELYATHDGGTLWEPVAAVPVDDGTTSADGLPFALLPSVRGAVVLPDNDHVSRASDRGEIATAIAPHGTAGKITRLEMVTPAVGWATQTFGMCAQAPPTSDQALLGSGGHTDCRSETRLLGTSDGGQTWTTLQLPRSASSAAIRRDDAEMGPAEDLRDSRRGDEETGLRVTGSPHLFVADSRTAVFVGQGFDKCEIPDIAQLSEWIVESPYRAANLYIGGVGRACSNLALTSSRVLELSQLGWRFIPTWVGPQAPCYPYGAPRMSPDPVIARAQGASEANAAADVAAALGLAGPDGSGTIIYDDMEYYDATNAACHEAVKAFISGWSGQLRARGTLAGVYATGSPLSTFTTLSDIPNAIWPAHWVSSSYDPSATVWDVYRLSNDLWNEHQRIRQYTGGHLETWGSVSLNIDCNVIDGIVASTGPQTPAFHVYLPLVLINSGSR